MTDRAVSSIDLTLSVADGNSDLVSLSAEYVVAGDDTPRPVLLQAVENLSAFASTATGRQLNVSWSLTDQAGLDNEPTSLADTNGDGIVDTLAVDYGDEGPRAWTLRLTAVDEDGLRSDTQTVGPILVGNRAPTLTLNESTLVGEQRGGVLVSFSMVDDAPDVSEVEIEFRPEGELEWRRAAIEFGETQGLLPRPGASFAVSWDSRLPPVQDRAVPQGIGNQSTRVDLRVRAVDESVSGQRFFGVWQRPSFTLQVSNQSPPRVLEARAQRSTSTGGFSPIRILYTVADDDSDSVSAEFEYSLDGSLNFFPCDEAPDWASEGRTNLATKPLEFGGVEHTFTWRPSGDFLFRPDALTLRVTVTDGNGENPASLTIPILRAPGEPSSVRPIPVRVTPGCDNGREPLDTTRVDISGDSDAELAVLCDDRITFYNDDGGGIFSSPVSIVFSDEFTWNRVADQRDSQFVDIDNDGVEELVAPADDTESGEDDGSVEVVALDRGPVLRSIASLASPHTNGQIAIAVVNLDGDALLDVAAAYRPDGLDEARISYWVQESAEMFTEEVIVSRLERAFVDGLGAVDFDDDGRDEIFASVGGSTLAIDFDFDGAQPEATSDTFSSALRDEAVVLDIDGDGVNEVVFGVSAFDDSVRPLVVSRPTSAELNAGVFQNFDEVELPAAPNFLQLFDANQDGRLDVYAIARSGDVFIALGQTVEGQATGALAPILTAPALSCGSINRVAVADYNGDGLADFEVMGTCDALVGTHRFLSEATSRSSLEFVSVAQQLTGVFEVLLDYDLDGQVDVSDQSQVVLSDGAGGGIETRIFLESERLLDLSSIVPLGPADDLFFFLERSFTDEPTLNSVTLDGVTARSQLALPIHGTDFTACDVDQDGSVELFGQGAPANELIALTLSGAAVSSPISFRLENVPSRVDTPLALALACADVDENGRPDILVPERITGRVAVLSVPVEEDYPVVVPRSIDVSAFGGRLDDLVVGDFDRDGHLDLALANDGRGFVAYGDGTLAFGDRFIVGSGGSSVSVIGVEAMDVDANGIEDLVLLGERSLSVLLDSELIPRTDAGLVDGFSSLAAETLSRPRGDYVRRAVGDLNADGIPDIAYGSDTSRPLNELTVSPAPLNVRYETLDRTETFVGTGSAALGGLVSPTGSSPPARLVISPFSIEPGQRRWDIDQEIHESGLINAPRGRALTPTLSYSGDVYLARTGTVNNDRLRVAPHPSLTGVSSASEFEASTDPATARAFIVEIPLPLSERGIAVEDIALIQRVRDWQRAQALAEDPLFADPAGADFIPRLANDDGTLRDIVRRRDFWRRIPAVANLDAAAGPRFVLVDDAAGLRLRVVTERLGIFVVYEDPTT
ncbi:MAG: VCBS repeat-containing protein [Myxococcota bacterium]